MGRRESNPQKVGVELVASSFGGYVDLLSRRSPSGRVRASLAQAAFCLLGVEDGNGQLQP